MWEYKVLMLFKMLAGKLFNTKLLVRRSILEATYDYNPRLWQS